MWVNLKTLLTETFLLFLVAELWLLNLLNPAVPYVCG